MDNIIEFPIDRRIEQMAIQDGFAAMNFDITNIEEETDQFLAGLVQDLFAANYRVDDEEYVCDISFMYETLKSLLLKMNNIDHPIQMFCSNLYWDVLHQDEDKQLEFDF